MGGLPLRADEHLSISESKTDASEAIRYRAAVQTTTKYGLRRGLSCPVLTSLPLHHQLVSSRTTTTTTNYHQHKILITSPTPFTQSICPRSFSPTSAPQHRNLLLLFLPKWVPSIGRPYIEFPTSDAAKARMRGNTRPPAQIFG
jgi:hypothetical protein